MKLGAGGTLSSDLNANQEQTMRKISNIILILCLLGIGMKLYDQAFARTVNWNDKNLSWLGYEQGLAQMKASGKPGLFIIYADWCPTCKEYAKLFADPDVVKAMKDVVLIRVNQDKEPEISKKYGLDGEYVPRSFALSSKGEIMKDLYENRSKFQYYLPANDPAYLVQFVNGVKLARAR